MLEFGLAILARLVGTNFALPFFDGNHYGESGGWAAKRLSHKKR